MFAWIVKPTLYLAEKIEIEITILLSFLAISLSTKLATTVTGSQDNLWVPLDYLRLGAMCKKNILRREILSVPFTVGHLCAKGAFSLLPTPSPSLHQCIPVNECHCAPNPNPNQTETFAGHALSDCPF